jgi:hypothetical protein
LVSTDIYFIKGILIIKTGSYLLFIGRESEIKRLQMDLLTSAQPSSSRMVIITIEFELSGM